MFDAKELDKKTVEMMVVNCLNDTFECLTEEPIEHYEDLVDQEKMVNLLIEMDDKKFGTLKNVLLFQKDFGVFYAEMEEIVKGIKEMLQETSIAFKSAYKKDFDSVNASKLIKKESNEVKKLVNLTVLAMFSCKNKESFIDRIANLEENYQFELLKIVERYMNIDENTRESILSRNVSQRNTIQNSPDLNLLDSEYSMKLTNRIEALEKEKAEIEQEKKQVENKSNEAELQVNKIEKVKKNMEAQNDGLKKEIDNLKEKDDSNQKTIFDLELKVKKLNSLIEEGRTEQGFKMKCIDLKSELKEQQQDFSEKEEKLKKEISSLREEADVLRENLSNLRETKTQNEKMKEMLKEFEAMKEKTSYYEAMSKELSKVKESYAKVSGEKSQLEEILDQYEENMQRKEPNLNEAVKSYKDQIRKLEARLEEPGPARGDFDQMLNMKDETIKTQEDAIHNFSDKIASLELQLKECESELTRRGEELEYFKKDNEETKDRYEKEFELMASSVYNLGLNYWSMKMEYTQKLAEKPSWIIKERRKYFNGDF